MAVLYVTEPKSKLYLEGKRLVVEVEDKLTHQFPSLKLDKVVIFGNVRIDTPVITHCLKEGIDMVFLSNKGQYYGRLQAPESKNLQSRRLQYEISSNPQKCVLFARKFIQGKVRNMRVLLQRHSGTSYRFHEIVNQLAKIVEQVKRATTLPEIRGLEGTASRLYFSVFGEMIPSGFKFEGRHRRPPTDPVNSLLSFGYTILVYEVFSAVAQVGFDPYFGLLHEDKYGRPSIALDLMEEYRPIIVDVTVLMVLNKKLVKRDDFYTSEEGAVLIADDARKKFIEQLEKRLNTKVQYQNGPRLEKISYRKTILKQVYRLLRAFKGEEEYSCVEIK
jgi:CRISPR-associated protein Cas1